MDLWMAWQMMKELHCTYTQLQQEPVQETDIFMAFSAGEAQGRKALMDKK